MLRDWFTTCLHHYNLNNYYYNLNNYDHNYNHHNDDNHCGS